MQINLTCIGSGTLITTQKLRFKAAQEDSLSAIVASLTMDPPHTFPMNVTLNVPNPVPHRVFIYSTPDETDGTLVASFTYDPTYVNVKVRMPLELRVGGLGPYDPAEGTDEIPVIEDMRGWDWWPEIRSQGGTLSSSEYTKVESVPGLGYDKFTVNIPDFAFSIPDFIFIKFLPQVSTATPVFTYLDLYTDVIEVPGDATLDASYYRKVIEFTSLSASPIFQLLDISSVPNGTLLTFSTMRGAQQQATIKASGTNSMFLAGGAYTAFFMGKGEVLMIMRRPDGWHVVNDWGAMIRTGQIYKGDIIIPNTIIFNGGGLADGGGNPLPLPRAIYPRVEWHVLTRLPSSYVMTKADRDAAGINASGYWAYDANSIWAPDMQGNFLRALPGNRGNDPDRNNTSKPGSYGADTLRNHAHWITSDSAGPGANPNARVIGRVPGGPGGGLGLNGVGGGWELMFGSPYTGVTLYDASGVPLIGGAETRPKHNSVIVGCYI